MQNYVQKGQTLTVVAPYALLSGGGWQVGNIFGVTVNTQNIGDSSELVVEGVFDLAKDASTFNPGDKVFWNNTALQATSSPLTAAGVSNKEIGYAVLSQASGVNAPGGLTGDATVRVRLNPLGFGPVQAADTDPSLIQKTVVTLTAAQIMAMFGAAVSILPAPAAGQVLVVDQFIVQMKPGATQFTGGGAVSFQYHGTGVVPHSSTIPAATVTSAAASENVVPPPTGVIQPPSASSPVSGRMVRVESWRATAAGVGATSGAIRASRAIRAVAAGSAMVSAHPALLGMLHGAAAGSAPVRAQLARVRPLAAAANGSAVLLAALAPVRGLAGIAAGGAQFEGVLGVVMRHLARTPGVRLIVIRKEVRALAVGPEVRVVAIPRERRVLVPAMEQRTLVVPAEIRSIAA